jgi:hypothetical protein
MSLTRTRRGSDESTSFLYSEEDEGKMSLTATVLPVCLPLTSSSLAAISSDGSGRTGGLFNPSWYAILRPKDKLKSTHVVFSHAHRAAHIYISHLTAKPNLKDPLLSSTSFQLLTRLTAWHNSTDSSAAPKARLIMDLVRSHNATYLSNRNVPAVTARMA